MLVHTSELVADSDQMEPKRIKDSLDLTNVEEITLSIIRGNGDNGGAQVDGSDHLRYRIDVPALGHTGGSHILVNANDTSFDSLKDVTIPLYPGERVNNAVLVLEQPVYVDTMVSSWGFTGLNYVVNSAASGDVRKTLFDVITGVAEFADLKVIIQDLELYSTFLAHQSPRLLTRYSPLSLMSSLAK